MKNDIIKKGRMTIAFGWIILALITLFNPNVSVFDPLPDFIGFIILAKLFERAADAVPYFEEARRSLTRLALVNLLKIFAVFLIIAVRSKNAADRDVIALCSFTFAVAEAIFAVKAISDSFTALFYLGQRTDAAALIEPRGRLAIPPALVEMLSVVFAITKSVLYALPDLFRLTRGTDGTESGDPSALYPKAVIICTAIGTVLGILWLISVIHYAAAVRREGKYEDAVLRISRYPECELNAAYTKRYIKKRMTAFTLGALFSIEIAFSDMKNINLLPHFVSLMIFTLAFFRMCGLCKGAKSAAALGCAAAGVSVVSYILRFRFLDSYSYSMVADSTDAAAMCRAVRISLILELAVTAVFLVFAIRAFSSIVRRQTGIPPESERYNARDAEYHRSLTFRCAATFALYGIMRLCEVTDFFLRTIVRKVSDTGLLTVSNPAPWFTVIVSAVSALFILVAIFTFMKISNEADIKYTV